MSITEKAMLVKPRITMWSGRKQDNRVRDAVKREFDTDPNVGNFTKKLVKSDALDAYKSVAGEARSYVYQVTLPWEDGGTRMLAASLYYDFRAEMQKFVEKADQHASEFVCMYDDLKKDAELYLGKLYRPSDYPDAAEMRGRFGISYSITPIPTIGNWVVEGLEQERAQIEADLNALYDRKLSEAYQDLWGRLYEQAEKIYERLVDPGAIFKSKLIDTAVEVCELMGKLNINDDQDLSKVTEDFRLKVLGNNVNVLRANATKRHETAMEAKKIMDRMSAYMTPA